MGYFHLFSIAMSAMFVGLLEATRFFKRLTRHMRKAHGGCPVFGI